MGLGIVMINKEQSYLYHFMPIHKFIDFVLNKSLTLTSLSFLEDKFDGISSEDASKFFHLHKTQKEFDQDDFFKRITWGAPNVDNIFDNIREFRNRSLSCCFYYPKKAEESIAMWKLYSQKDSVALKIPKKELEIYIDNNNFEHYSVLENGDNDKILDKTIFYKREIEYIDFFSDLVDNTTPQGFIKHKDYSFENEYRLLLVNDLSEEKFWREKADEIKENSKNPNDPKTRAQLLPFEHLAKTSNPKIYRIELSSEILSKSFIIASPFIEKWKLKNLRAILSELDFNIELQYSRSLPKVIMTSF
jgi:hypothetical protein